MLASPMARASQNHEVGEEGRKWTGMRNPYQRMLAVLGSQEGPHCQTWEWTTPEEHLLMVGSPGVCLLGLGLDVGLEVTLLCPMQLVRCQLRGSD